MSKTYPVTITVTLENTVNIKANSPEEAEKTAKELYKSCSLILDFDNLTKVEFSAKEE